MSGHTPSTPRDPHSHDFIAHAQIRQVEPRRPTRIYVESDSQHAELWRMLSAAGVHFTSTWIRKLPTEESTKQSTDAPAEKPNRVFLDASARAVILIKEVEESDAFLWYTPPDQDSRTETILLGVALALKKPVAIVGPAGFDRALTYHPLVTRVPTLRAALKECGVIMTDPIPSWMPD